MNTSGCEFGYESPDPRQAYPDSVTPILDENYKYVDISTFQKTPNRELGRNSCLSLLVANLGWKLFLACIKGQFATCRQQTGGEGCVTIILQNYCSCWKRCYGFLCGLKTSSGQRWANIMRGMLQHFTSTLRYNYEKQFKARKIRCFENTEKAMKFRFRTVHLALQTFSAYFGL